VRRGLVEELGVGRELIANSRVTVGGALATKSQRMVSAADPVVLLRAPSRYVCRSAHKLDAALDRFGLDVTGLRALDVGASTGGFTDCLLQRGAGEVTALDVGHGQLDPKIRHDDRVLVRERCDVRKAQITDVGGPFDLIVVDVSFVSLERISADLTRLAAPRAEAVVLVKPQFEASEAEVGRGRGVITDPEIWRRALHSTIADLEVRSWSVAGLMAAPLKGAKGNTEFPLWLVRSRVEAPNDPGPRDAGPVEPTPTRCDSAVDRGRPSVEELVERAVTEAAAPDRAPDAEVR